MVRCCCYGSSCPLRLLLLTARVAAIPSVFLRKINILLYESFLSRLLLSVFASETHFCVRSYRVNFPVAVISPASCSFVWSWKWPRILCGPTLLIFNLKSPMNSSLFKLNVDTICSLCCPPLPLGSVSANTKLQRQSAVCWLQSSSLFQSIC